MGIEIRQFHKKDFGQAITFAITGMHFERYTDMRWELEVSVYGDGTDNVNPCSLQRGQACGHSDGQHEARTKGTPFLSKKPFR